MDLSIIIVSWNVKDLLRDNLRTIFENSHGISFEVFVVDNNSHDGTVIMVEKEFPSVTIIANPDNKGFSKANNQAIELSQGRYVLLFNPDMRILPNTLTDMVEWMDKNPKAGIASCHLVDGSGNTIPHVRRFPGVIDQLALIFKIPHVFPRILDKYMMREFDYLREASVDSIRGSFFMIRRSVIDRLGGLDERYFIWFEEVDFCRQARDAGWSVMYTPSVQCIDYVGKSFAQIMAYKKQKMFTDSMLKYFKKWHPFSAIFIYVTRPVGLGLTFLYDKIKNLKSF